MGYHREDNDVGGIRGRGCRDSDVGGVSDGNCIKGTVRRILDAQRRANDDSSFGCDNSCDQSIEDLLSPSRDRMSPRHDTIPFMLTCKDGCKTFVGSGFASRGSRDRDRGRRRDHFECVESPVFKVRGFVRGSNSCVRLELLAPIYHRHRGDGEDDHGGRYETHHDSCGGSVCSFFGHRRIENFCYTGVCITVDLDCFCGISCLDPITPEN